MSDRINTISVVAGGWSVTQIDLDCIPGFVIAVNDSAILLPRVDLVVSMDRLWTEHRFKWLHERQQKCLLRRSAVQNLPSINWPWMRIFECDYESTEFTNQDGYLNGTNSGMCAFNRAYQMRPFEIILFGFDMQRGPKGQMHWFPDYPWDYTSTDSKLKRWSRQFEDAALKCNAAGISVINASTRSLIKTFPKTSEFMKKRAVA